ncbi:M28 family peptidase [Lewinella cohaerens]|uniref:M28 family peptidase n=1 Tax=Lewinella cohaerens TaxID=70995 RepID=UPI00036BA28A|nr:M28 family peptidase [Lewinella cohaerens]
MKYFYYILLFLLSSQLNSQTNLVITNPLAEEILRGNFTPDDYLPPFPVTTPSFIAENIDANISPDSLKSYLEVMRSFRTRHTSSDTTSATEGMGAARRWALAKFQSFSDRLIPSYFQFDFETCGVGQHRNIFAVLPGTGPHYQEVVLVEAHFDSRCGELCDTECTAEGMEDNGSGSAAVLELARVMSLYTFDRTILFVLTTGEEQGLLGAEAFSSFFFDEDLPLKAVYNNDIVGGIICGATASPPGCPGLNDIDSTNVRIYSSGNLNSRNKMLARFVKLEYEEMIAPIAAQTNVINIMSTEDRTGRGGDHIPFRSQGFPAIRFTSANEHGDVSTSDPDYHDRQHTSDDILGIDTDGDEILDSFFVDFNYLARNTVINGNAIAMTALGPEPAAAFELNPIDVGFEVVIDDPNNYGTYRVGVRQFSGLDFDTIYTLQQATDTLLGLIPDQLYVVSVATVDENGVESLFIGERFNDFETGLATIAAAQENIKLLQNRPNPFDEATYFGVWVDEVPNYSTAEIVVRDLQGRTLSLLPITLNPGLNEVLYNFEHHSYQPGVYTYTLMLDDYPLITKRMMYAY